ncbi:MAG: UDP-N-acetylglucosamine 1-carboxyvinyltransferase [Parcubacteria group bacterium CG_4_9_14_0_2_um_filter_35_11]|nr:MAG: UDP-N-acetylglucosamine 1-carboxyvinyltransferase [Parcubacteria group bacterium CG07_land_8_20_14_0_80_35_11]PJC47464.1 MAG: UDP-N-acetylglucosamine 1-carboxyvinyltransferase [Parcubacteria group bacterium CG_4_9_14_0_2_um_filter_35_11]
MSDKDYFVIEGEKALRGEIEIRGCKNAATSIIAATLLTSEPCYIKNLPLVEDIFRMLEIIEALGAKVDWQGKREVKIEAKNIDPSKIREDLVTMLRSSVFLLGPLLARFGRIQLPKPGGCLIGVRPIDAHLDGFGQLGANIKKIKGEICKYTLSAKKLTPSKVILPEFSVTATENLLMAASLIEGKTIIKIAALEPHVKDLATVLVKMGAKIRWFPDHTVEIIGKKRLSGFSHSIIYDSVEAGSFLILAGVVGNDVIIKNVPLLFLDLVVKRIREFGISISKVREKGGLSILKVKKPKKFLPVPKIQVLPYPGIPTDLQCAFGVLASQAPGETLIHDPLYEGRLKYLKDLNKMGAQILFLDAHRAIVKGPSKLHGTSIENYDLRSGAALIIASLIAKGKSIIFNAYQVDRGYEKIEERLRKLGANIKRIKP